jgi:Acetyl-CoA acetyltransferase
VARIAVKNHHNGSLNPYAHFQSEVSLDEVMNSRVIADPLRIYEFCPVSDGSVSIMMTSEENASSMSGDYVEILGTGAASGTLIHFSQAESHINRKRKKGFGDGLQKIWGKALPM